MRNFQKRQFLDIVDELHMLHQQSRDHLLKKEYPTVQNILADCQENCVLPYKASMWDSLESVYLAAKEDEECDVYVIPVSYYDKLPGVYSIFFYRKLNRTIRQALIS